MKSQVISVLGGVNPPTPVVTQDGSSGYPMAVAIRNMHASESVYFGDQNVTVATGFPIDAGSIPLSVDVVNEDLYAICTTGPVELRVLRRGG
jgi:hypothetical protein